MEGKSLYRSRSGFRRTEGADDPGLRSTRQPPCFTARHYDSDRRQSAQIRYRMILKPLLRVIYRSNCLIKGRFCPDAKTTVPDYVSVPSYLLGVTTAALPDAAEGTYPPIPRWAPWERSTSAPKVGPSLFLGQQRRTTTTRPRHPRTPTSSTSMPLNSPLEPAVLSAARR